MTAASDHDLMREAWNRAAKHAAVTDRLIEDAERHLEALRQEADRQWAEATRYRNATYALQRSA